MRPQSIVPRDEKVFGRQPIFERNVSPLFARRRRRAGRKLVQDLQYEVQILFKLNLFGVG